ncbi:hypothetical protein P7K49_014431 [Saguinus oedipus]|uniref:Uncharacterized protein n=1 Tax=Saguinus oedipus TaxID=9490 RepID=A0ABQ9VJE9_SAGOE|nr:hypothetical protein P7K49_014431 [Saguinus oedipus]
MLYGTLPVHEGTERQYTVLYGTLPVHVGTEHQYTVLYGTLPVHVGTELMALHSSFAGFLLIELLWKQLLAGGSVESGLGLFSHVA